MRVIDRPACRPTVVAWRIAWTLATLVIVETIVCGLAAMPVVLAWMWLLRVSDTQAIVRVAIVSAALVPSYVAFAACLMVLSPIVTRLVGWRSPADAEMRIRDMEWRLLWWFRYLASIHVVRVVAGTLFRGTPMWTAHLRLSGARLGKRVYVNSLSVSDYNLIECGDDVVIGGGVCLAGHTVEAGVVKTARVRIGRNVTIGLGSVIEIGVDIGSDSQIGALSFVPKHTALPSGGTYVGAPAVRIE